MLLIKIKYKTAQLTKSKQKMFQQIKIKLRMNWLNKIQQLKIKITIKIQHKIMKLAKIQKVKISKKLSKLQNRISILNLKRKISSKFLISKQQKQVQKAQTIFKTIKLFLKTKIIKKLITSLAFKENSKKTLQVVYKIYKSKKIKQIILEQAIRYNLINQILYRFKIRSNIKIKLILI
ncbi:hypothetical protein TTHERM_000545779 (macronuclear) [Tetrahymena thermophila SB210]|uniref:Uncharacterized protein n=1 Tax=Tetrahymena thermophila (strain SB210) TaxID=312017 RepID=W7XHI5_TETTS|nr:hypothetical protein TTHERM_000545779 [Tetrahymena thermophila SB210]EWS76738.1 hypothetical protein TTHERM_000545779 [Tetrahymena thermophila SB210]|eukprot:XP_012650731.1 hypothetical protein TTHERM_000545779 [Tetrahymena thermophila SB210]